MDHHQEDDIRNIKLYSTLLEQHGDSHKSLNWGSSTSQQSRFDILAGVGLQPNNSVLDVGCGLGHFLDWILENVGNVQYTGIDLTPAMIEKAKERYPDANFLQSSLHDFLSLGDRFDYVVSSGIFYYRRNNPNCFMKNSIREMYECAKTAVAFNSLSSWCENQDEYEFYADPVKTIEICHGITNKVVFRHDYHSSDFTIYLYK